MRKDEGFVPCRKEEYRDSNYERIFESFKDVFRENLCRGSFFLERKLDKRKRRKDEREVL